MLNHIISHHIQMTDPIGDFIVRIKNAGMVKKEAILLPFSKIKKAIADVLLIKGFIASVSEKVKDNKKYLEIGLSYEKNGSPKIKEVVRVSKPGRRIYEKAKDIKKFRRGFGIAVFSTSKGIMADADAKNANIGGEFLFKIW